MSVGNEPTTGRQNKGPIIPFFTRDGRVASVAMRNDSVLFSLIASILVSSDDRHLYNCLSQESYSCFIHPDS